MTPFINRRSFPWARVRPGLTPSQITALLLALEDGTLQIREDEDGIPMLELNPQLGQLVDTRVWS